MNQKQVLEKIYAGFLGMNIGIRLGAPVEPAFWSSDRIREYYGDIRGYVKEYRHFAADDDANGPVFFLRAMDDMKHSGEPTPQDVAEAWLNYAREGIGLYWWGGYGVSTEHTAYLNLKNGIPAPQSGSIRQNGKTAAEQIGGQIFIDTWGLISPGDPDQAARMAKTAASVSHDGEGLHGAAFMAAAIAAAFEAGTIGEVIAEGLARIPGDCLYRRVFDAVRAFYAAHPEDWRLCLEMLQREWGYDRYPGACHIIPNAGVCALALWYGGGDYARTIEIATMCSWDTDCNAGNVGTILGVFAGLKGIPAHYRDPVNDEIVLSGISGYLNVLDLPGYAKKLLKLACGLKGIPCEISAPREGTLACDFMLPGATHGFTVSDPVRCAAAPSKEYGGSLRVLFEKMIRGESFRLGKRTFYRRRDFDDERYMPVFSPLACPGQEARFRLIYEKIHGDQLSLTPYALETYSGKLYTGEPVIAEPGETEIAFRLPEADGGVIEEVGLLVTSLSQAKLYDAGCLFLTSFELDGKASCTFDLRRSVREFASILPFSHNHGAWNLEDGRMTAVCLSHAEAMTGNYYTRDVRATGRIIPLNGDSHLIGVRVQGAQRGIYAGLGMTEGKPAAVIGRTAGGKWECLAADPFPWELNREYEISVEARGNRISLRIDGKPVLSRDIPDAYPCGMISFAMYAMGRASYGSLTIDEEPDAGCSGRKEN